MKGEFHAPNLQEEYFPGELYNDFIIGGAGDWFAMDRLMVVRLLMAVIVGIFFVIAFRRPKLVPTGLQNVAEMMMDFVRIHVAEEILGKKEGRRFLPVLATIFFLVISMNLAAIIPGMNMAATATVTMPLVFALWTFVQYWIAACREKGFLQYLRGELMPPGVPLPIDIILGPINLLEALIIRPFSLTVRLFANMIAGHLLVATCLAFTQFYLIEASNWAVKPVGVLWLLGGFAFVCFEMFVAALQAYVFSILSTVYINQSYPEVE